MAYIPRILRRNSKGMSQCISGNLSITTGQAGTVCVDLVPQDPPVANEARAVLPSDNTRHHAPLKEETEEGEQGGKPRLQDSSVVQVSAVTHKPMLIVLMTLVALRGE